MYMVIPVFPIAMSKITIHVTLNCIGILINIKNDIQYNCHFANARSVRYTHMLFFIIYIINLYTTQFKRQVSSTALIYVSEKQSSINFS